MYSRRPKRTSQRSIQNLSGYTLARRAPRGATTLRGLGRADRSRMPEGGYIYDSAGNIVGVNNGNPIASDATKPFILPVPLPVNTTNYTAAPASTPTVSTGFSISDVPWWGWALAAFAGYSLLGGMR